MVIVHSYVKLPEGTHSSKIKKRNPSHQRIPSHSPDCGAANQGPTAVRPRYKKHNMDPAKVPSGKLT